MSKLPRGVPAASKTHWARHLLTGVSAVLMIQALLVGAKWSYDTFVLPSGELVYTNIPFPTDKQVYTSRETVDFTVRAEVLAPSEVVMYRVTPELHRLDGCGEVYSLVDFTVTARDEAIEHHYRIGIRDTAPPGKYEVRGVTQPIFQAGTRLFAKPVLVSWNTQPFYVDQPIASPPAPCPSK
jgi:hypothetical protein